MIIPVSTVRGYHFRSATERAMAEGIVAIPSNVKGIYATSRSRDGLTVYMTDVRPDTLGCTCMAGDSGKICKHVAAAAMEFGNANDLARQMAR